MLAAACPVPLPDVAATAGSGDAPVGTLLAVMLLLLQLEARRVMPPTRTTSNSPLLLVLVKPALPPAAPPPPQPPYVSTAEELTVLMGAVSCPMLTEGWSGQDTSAEAPDSGVVRVWDVELTPAACSISACCWEVIRILMHFSTCVCKQFRAALVREHVNEDQSDNPAPAQGQAELTEDKRTHSSML
jgi:hypothetical protein